MAVRIYHYPIIFRLWHGINAMVFLILILTGISMQYSNPDAPFIAFPTAVSLHNIGGIILSVNYMLFVLGNIFTRNGEHYRPEWKGSRQRLLQQFRYYTNGMFNGEKPPYPVDENRKFNPLQKFTYLLAMYVGLPVLFITGWGLLFPDTILDRVFGLNGLFFTDLVHVITGFLLSIFMIIHIYFCTIGLSPFRNFRSILTGWHED